VRSRQGAACREMSLPQTPRAAMIAVMLDLAAAEACLTTPWRLEWHEQVTSTNDLVRAAARQGAAEGLVVGAESQTAGRGRHGRTWVDVPGRCLLFSVLLRPGDDAVGRLLGLAAAASVVTAAARRCGLRTGVLWPNDVVYGRAKLAGILVEQTQEVHVVGIGVNVLGTGEGLPCDRAVTTVQAVARAEGGHDEVRREALLAAILDEMHRYYGELKAGNRQGLMATIAEADQLKGRRVSVREAGREVTGTALGTDEEGRLGLLGPEGELWVRSGEVTSVG